MTDSKASLRKHFLEIRKAISPLDASLAADLAADNFLKSIKIKNAGTIAFYHPINGEIDPRPLFGKILEKMPIPLWKRLLSLALEKKLLKPFTGKLKSPHENIMFSLPAIKNKDEHLLFYPWQLGSELVSNAIYPQILEPKAQEHITPDIIIVPLVAFDENCNRLGYGGGFYDKTLAHLKANNFRPITVGYAYECQKSGTPLPTEPHDIKLDFVITEKQIYTAT